MLITIQQSIQHQHQQLPKSGLISHLRQQMTTILTGQNKARPSSIFYSLERRGKRVRIKYEKLNIFDWVACLIAPNIDIEHQWNGVQKVGKQAVESLPVFLSDIVWDICIDKFSPTGWLQRPCSDASVEWHPWDEYMLEYKRWLESTRRKHWIFSFLLCHFDLVFTLGYYYFL